LPDLTDIITYEQFEHIEKTFRRHYKLGLETINADGQVVRSMCSGDCFGSFCKTVRSSKIAAKRCKQDHLKSLKLAFETGQPYMSFCHAGIILVSAPIMDRDTPLGGVLFGKCLWKKPDELFAEDLKKQLKGLRLDFDKLLKEANQLPVLSGKKNSGSCRVPLCASLRSF